MKQVYSLYECSDRAIRMIPYSQFPILALPMGVWSEYYQYWKLLSKYIEHFWTVDVMPSSSQDCSFNDKALCLWEKCDF